MKIRQLLLLLALVLGTVIPTGCSRSPVAEPSQGPIDVQPLAPQAFWQILDRANQSGLEHGQLREKLVSQLADLTEPQLASFKAQYVLQINRLFVPDVVAAFSIVLDGFSDEAFFIFRDGLVARGAAGVEQVLEDPESIVQFLDPDTVVMEDHSFFLAADDALRIAAKDPMATLNLNLNFSSPMDAAPFDIGDDQKVQQQFPKLWEYRQRRARRQRKAMFEGGPP